MTPGNTTPTREDLFDNAASKIRYQAYSRLQSTAVAFGESLPIPEIVAIGGQSDGKSSLMEALLGFRFNVCSSEMGTRRPLIVQMVHDPSAQEPRCRLQNEEGDDYGEILPQDAIAEAIKDRTESHLRRLGAPVSSKPIIMRAEYAFCPNLTIIDTPGFILKARQGEAESTPDDILAMVKEQCAPRHRIILFVQQASVEWCSSVWMHVLQDVDPDFSRTVMVTSKFDNRVKELSERWELEKYLSAAGYLPPTVKPFFVALPKDRNHATSAEWRKAIQVVDSGIKSHLRANVKGGFDEERFGSRMGFGNLKRFLEDELARRYRDSAPATLALLQERCSSVRTELDKTKERLRKAGDVGSLRKAAIKHTLGLAGRLDGVMAGFGGADPKCFGMSTEEERQLVNVAWPGSPDSHPLPMNAALKLFGGAAFERCLEEFARVVEKVAFPAVPRDQVANMLLAQRSRGDGAGAAARAAEELARTAARQVLSPLLDAVCVRLGSIIRRAYEVAAEVQASDDALRPYLAFHSSLRTAFNEIAAALERKGKDLLQAHLTTATGHFSAAALLEAVCESAGMQQYPEESWAIAEDDAAGEQENEAPMAVQPERPPFLTTQMTVPETPSPDLTASKSDAPLGRRVQLAAGAGRNVDANSPAKGRVSKQPRLAANGSRSGAAVSSRLANGSRSVLSVGGGYVDVCAAAEQLFGAVKESMAAQGPGLKAIFLEPLHTQLASDLCVEMVGKNDTEFMDLFAAAGALTALEAERDALQRRADALVKMTEEFGELARAL